MKKVIRSGVYKITNLITGIIYIGSSVDLDSRRKGHFKYNHHNKYLKRAFKKYSESNFIWEELEFCEPENCTEREQYYLNTLLFAKEFIESNYKDDRFIKLSYNINPTANSNLGMVVTEETKKKKSKSVIQFDLDGNIISKFYSCRDAVLKTGITGINQACNDLRSQMRGFRWMFEQDYLNNKKFIELDFNKGKSVLCIDKQGNFIKEYNTINEASLEIGVQISSISRVCKNKAKTAGGFKWKYKYIKLKVIE